MKASRAAATIRALTNDDRKQWVDNDEGLYLMWKASGLSKDAFVRDHKVDVNTVINKVLSGEEQAHYLAYPRR